MTNNKNPDNDDATVYHIQHLTPPAGLNYYKLKTNLLDESYVYSQVATVDIQEVEKFALVPNPASESVQVALSDVQNENVQIKIINQFGAEQSSIDLGTVNSSYAELSLAGYKEGLYYVWIQIEGRRAVTRKLVVVKP